MNFANGDVIGHTSCNSAKIAAASHMSRQLERLVSAAKAQDYVVMITADHGNLESMITPTGKPDVAHTTNPVPFLVIDLSLIHIFGNTLSPQKEKVRERMAPSKSVIKNRYT